MTKKILAGIGLLCLLTLATVKGWVAEVPEYVTHAIFDPHTHSAATLTTTNMKRSAWLGAGGLSVDGTFCTAAQENTLGSQPLVWIIECNDDNNSTIYGTLRMPDSWDGGTLQFTLVAEQRAADTGALVGHVMAQCRGHGEAVGSWGTEVAITDANVTGNGGVDQTISGPVTPAGTCAAGDMLFMRYQVDAPGTTTNMNSIRFLGFMVKFGISSLSD